MPDAIGGDGVRSRRLRHQVITHAKQTPGQQDAESGAGPGPGEGQTRTSDADRGESAGADEANDESAPERVELCVGR